MQYPATISIGNTDIPLHAVLETAGIFIGFRYFLYLRKKQKDPIEQENRIWIIIGAIFGAVIGSRLIGSLENPPGLFSAKKIWLYIYSNKTVVGGFLGGLFGVELVKKIIGEKKASGDLFTLPMILALIIGRMGCFSMGVHEETYGLPTKAFTGMDLGDGLLRHPVTLYEIFFLTGLGFLIVFLDKKLVFVNGGKFKFFMIAYLAFRFFLDFFKPHYTFNMGLSTIQLTCVAGLLYYLRFVINPKILFINYQLTITNK